MRNVSHLPKWKLLFVVVVVPLLYIYYTTKTLPFLQFEEDTGAVVFDSLTYMKLANEFDGLTELISLAALNKNLLGPVLLVQLLNKNTLHILIFNILIYYLSMCALLNSGQIMKNKFFIMVTANPLIFSSLTSINKEIIATCAIILTLAYTLSNKKIYFVLAVAISIFSRSEMTAILLAYFFLRKIKEQDRRWRAIAAIVTVITLIIPITGSVGSTILLSNQKDDSLGFTILLNEVCLNFGFFAAVIPKILLNLFGDIRYIFTFLTGQTISYTAVSGVLFFIALAKSSRRIRPSNDIGLLLIIYAIIFAVPSFVHHRYYLPIYPAILAILFLKQKTQDSTYRHRTI